MASEHRCHLFELPAEIRNRIYDYALAPTGSLTLTSTWTKRNATVPVVAPALLATCRQIHSEAADILYTENSVSRLPQRVLEKLQHLTVVLDASSYFGASYADVDWTAFSALVSLRTLRIALITVRATPSAPDSVTDWLQPLPDLVAEILERIPASTELFYETTAGSEGRNISDFLIEIGNKGRIDKLIVKEISDRELSEITMEAMENVDRGCKSGVVDDVFWEHRNELAAKCGAMRI